MLGRKRLYEIKNGLSLLSALDKLLIQKKSSQQKNCEQILLYKLFFLQLSPPLPNSHLSSLCENINIGPVLLPPLPSTVLALYGIN